MNVAKNDGDQLGERHHIAKMLSGWWLQPDCDSASLWASADYQQKVLSIWREVMGEGQVQPIRNLFSAAMSDGRELPMEYERLFVGPAAIPCPPYEAVWRKDRPKHEQGTVMGPSTSDVVGIYRELGLQFRREQMELADHLAIELEALAFAWTSGEDAIAHRLSQRINFWIPDFCASVVENSRIEFYRGLAMITERCFAEDSPLVSCNTREKQCSSATTAIKPNNNSKAAKSVSGKE